VTNVISNIFDVVYHNNPSLQTSVERLLEKKPSSIVNDNKIYLS
jgi:hypothetical protein